MALSPLIKGRNNIIKHFKSTKHSVWKLYNANDTKSPMQTHISKSPADAIASLEEMLDVLDPSGSFILDTFLPLPGNDKNYVRADTSMPFTLSEASNEKQPIQGTGNHLNYTPAFGDHIKLIQDNAKISAELDYTKQLYSDTLKEIERLRNELRVAESLLDEYEAEEDEEEEKSGVSGVPKNAEEAVAKLITEHGGVVIEHFFNKEKGLKDELQLSNDKTPINGIDTTKMPDLNTIVQVLASKDSRLHEHLYKLALIAQQKPIKFKFFLDQLDKM